MLQVSGVRVAFAGIKKWHLNTDTFCWKTASLIGWFIFVFVRARIEA
jgi:hypothetical protein